MRLSILVRGHKFRTRVLLAAIGLLSRHPVVDAVKLALYRPDFYPAAGLTQEAMRGPSDWSVGDRELMAAFVSQVNRTEFCVLAHTATSALAYGDEQRVSATLADLDSAPIEEPLRATLRLLGKLTRENRLNPDDVRRTLAAGVSAQQITHGQRVVLRDLRLPDDKPRQVDQGMHEPGVDPPRWELSRGKHCSLDRGHALFASRASLPRSAQVPTHAHTNVRSAGVSVIRTGANVGSAGGSELARGPGRSGGWITRCAICRQITLQIADCIPICRQIARIWASGAGPRMPLLLSLPACRRTPT